MVAMNGSGGRKEHNDLLSRVATGASEALNVVKDQTRAATREVKRNATEVARAVVDSAQDEAERLYVRHKSRMGSKVGRLGKAAKQTAHALHAVRADAAAEYLEAFSDKVGAAQDYLEEQSLGDILSDAGDFVRQNRAAAAGGLFLIGFVAARFLKSSAQRPRGDDPEEGADAEEPLGRREKPSPSGEAEPRQKKRLPGPK